MTKTEITLLMKGIGPVVREFVAKETADLRRRVESLEQVNADLRTANADLRARLALLESVAVDHVRR